MLVITRREGEEVVIGDPKSPIGTVRIASIRGDRVRLAFDFPRHIQVHRREIADQIGRDGSTKPVPAAEGDAPGTAPATPAALPTTPIPAQAPAAKSPAAGLNPAVIATIGRKAVGS